MNEDSENKYICTYFDKNFLPRGLALYKSIGRFHNSFIFYVLALDNETYDYLQSLEYENLVIISPSSYNSYFNISPDRYSDKKQYYFSATPNLCLYIMQNYPEVNLLLYLDADVYVFNSLDCLYDEMGEASIAICSHRFHPLFKLLSKNYGHYNVGVNIFRRSEEGIKCLNDWKNDCDSWYPGKPDYPFKIFYDQIFLDGWTDRYNEIKVIENIGVDVAPWNIVNYRFTIRNGSYFVNGKPLIIYHFSSLKKISENVWNGNTIYYFCSIKGVLRNIYRDYIKEIESFNLDNTKFISITHNDSRIKKAYHYIMSFIMNENIVV
ncbi:MAG TPA: hypothetical protein PLN06_00425 [Bacteroidales bacterium]|nr:hypothetical protein [Bacteroidales bacterium]HCI54506.1 hypothetical protein [Bacteroidales bacterium]HOU95075.1 hypothetical protein [Bacteroidales bacterium]HQG36435.1 hypothetical protein [Bacteroidales bacterium]HQG53659.1 hypothetical protein [Bacteroidales bacterium]